MGKGHSDEQPEVKMEHPTGRGPKGKRDGLYIHPRDKILKPTKVSCSSCIAGHRSGECAHYDRILLQIRAAGRPSTACHHNASCGGACLKQNAYVIPSNEPRWCGCHRSCIENWEYSEHCPPYPVSAKRRQRSPSPSRPSRDSSSTANSTQQFSSINTPSQVSSSCGCESSKQEPQSNPSMPGPSPLVVAPPMVMATSQAQSPWQFDNIAAPHNPQLEDSRSDPMPLTMGYAPYDVVQADRSILQGYQFDMQNSNGPYAPFTDPLNRSGQSSCNTQMPASTRHPIRPVQVPRHYTPPNEQTHPCPGNGFQCPCDDNCACQECFTHGRGFWTLTDQFGTDQVSTEGFPMDPIDSQMPPYAAANVDGHGSWSDIDYCGQQTFIDPQSMFMPEDMYDPRWAGQDM